MFKNELCTKERENELWSEWNSLGWSDISSNHPAATKEKVMKKLLKRFDDLRRWLTFITIMDHIHKKRLLFAVANLDEWLISRT